MAKKWLVSARMRIDYKFTQSIEAPTEKAAVKRAETEALTRLGITSQDVIDDEFYCEPIKEWGMKR